MLVLFNFNMSAMKFQPNWNTKFKKLKKESRFSKKNQMKKSQLEIKKLKKEKRNKNLPICLQMPLVNWTTEKNLKTKNGLKSNKNMIATHSFLKKPSKSLFQPYNLDSFKKILRLYLLKSLNTLNNLQSLNKREEPGLGYFKYLHQSLPTPQFRPTKVW